MKSKLFIVIAAFWLGTVSLAFVQTNSSAQSVPFSWPEFTGTVGGSNLFLAYMNVVLLADAYATNCQADSTILALLRATQELAVTMRKALEKVRNSNQFAPEDQLVISDMELVLSGIEQMASALQTLIQSQGNDQTAAQRYNTLREQTWKRLSRILDLPE